jgi:hypothetical protein
MLAVITAVGRVGAVLGSLQLARADDFVMQAETLRDLGREAPVALRVARTVGRDCDGAVAERFVSHACQVRTVDPAAISNHDGSKRR